MKSALLCLREVRDSLTHTERTIADYILAHPEKVVDMSIYDITQNTFTSPSSVVRVCHASGFSGYKELHKALAYDIATLRHIVSHTEQDIARGDAVTEIIDKITSKNIQSLEDTRRLLAPEVVEECVDLLCNCNTVFLFGIGSSLCVARDAYLKFLRLNKPCVLNDDWHSQLLQSRNSSSKDVGIVLSYSGQTAEIIECMKNLRINKTPCIAITRFSPSPVAELATYKLYTSANESLFRNGAMSSRIAQLNVMDILYTAYANRNYDYCIQQLTRTHIAKTGSLREEELAHLNP